MPSSVVAAVVGSVVGEALAGSIAFGLLDAGLAFGAELVVGRALGGLAGAVVGNLAGGAVKGALYSNDSPSFTAQAQQRTHVLRSTVANRQIVYGRAMVSGPLVFAAGSSDNQTLHMVIALAGHECDAVESIWFNDEEVGARDGNGNVTAGRYAGKAKIVAHLGASDQSADASLVSANVGWTAAHRLRGVCYLYVKLTWDQNIYPRGIPNIKAVVRGKKLFDPRTATTVWSQNFALAVRDYLTGSHGLAAPAAEIDDDYFIAAANVADEDVALSGGGTENRYACNGVIDLGATPRQSLEALLSAGAGVLVWSAGQYRLHAGAYDTPDATALTADDLRGQIVVRPRIARQALFNAVRGTYVDPAKYWQPGDFPPVSNATYATQDGATIYRDIALPMTTSVATAQRLAKLQVERSRQGTTIDFPAKLTQLRRAVWDVVPVTIAALGWSAKPFRVVDWQFAPAGGVDLVLQEEAAASYDWNSGMETVLDPAPDTNLPDPFTCSAPGVPYITESLYETREVGGVKVRVVMTCAPSEDAFAVGYRFEWRAAAASDWIVRPQVSEPVDEILDVAPGRYDFRVKAVNSIGVGSDYAVRSNTEVLGLAAPPSAVADLTIQAAGGLAILQWTRHADIDVRRGGQIVFRHSPAMSGATWETSTTIGTPASGADALAVLPLKAGTYLANAQDSSGVLSASIASITTKQASALAWSPLTTVQEDDEFSGIHSGTAVDGGVLYLVGAGYFDSISDVDAEISVDFYGGVLAGGTYDFSTGMDLGSVQHVRLTSLIAAQALNVLDLIDAHSGNVDTWADFDGTAGAPVDAWVEVRETDDDPAGTPTWSDWKRLDAAEFEARGFDFRCQLTSDDPAYTILISQLRASAAQIA